MRYVFSSFGSRGDLQPTLALAQRLTQKGHDVSVVGPPNFSDSAERFGVRYFGAGDDMQMLLEREKEHVKASPLVLMREMRRLLAEQFEAVTRVMDPLITSDTVVIASAVSLAAASFAAARKCRYHYVALQPQLFRESGLPPPVVPQAMGWPAWMNRGLAYAHDVLWTRFLRPMFAPLHARLGLPPVGDIWRHMVGSMPILACDPSMVGSLDHRMPECEGCVIFADDRPLSPKVESFLSRGSAPVYVGFGSMPDETPAESARMILGVARVLGVRLILSAGWAKLEAAESDDVCVIGDVSHSALFARVRAVVHHGGAGTTARVAFSGVAQLLVPHMLDQYYWGARVHKLGLGPKPLPRTRLSDTTFAQRLSELLACDNYAANAKDLAARMISDGVERIVRILES